VVGVSLVDIKDEVSVGMRDSLHKVVMVECLCAAPSSQVDNATDLPSGSSQLHIAVHVSQTVAPILKVQDCSHGQQYEAFPVLLFGQHHGMHCIGGAWPAGWPWSRPLPG